MLNFLKNSNDRISVKHLKFLFYTILIMFILLGLLGTVDNKTKSNIKFYSKSILVNEIIKSDNFPNGFHIKKEDVEEIKEEFQYVTIQTPLTSSIGGIVEVNLSSISDDFIYTGVSFLNQYTKKTDVEKVEFIEGNIWSKDSREPLIVIDEYTAKSIFGVTKVVGRTISSKYGDLRIVGVVSNTIEREQTIKRDKDRNVEIDESRYFGNAYISRGYFTTLEDVETLENETLIIRDDNLDIEELKTQLKAILNIPKDDKIIVVDRNDYMAANTPKIDKLFKILILIITFLILITIVKFLIQYYLAYKVKINKIDNTSVKINENSFGEGYIMGFRYSLFVILMGLFFLIVITLIFGIFAYISILNIVFLSFCTIFFYAFTLSFINYFSIV